MGQISFVSEQPDGINENTLKACYVAGLDAMPHSGTPVFENGLLTIHRSVDESGSLHTPWPVPGIGCQMVGTATLVERERPYLLELELARGTLNRLRNYHAAGELAGYETSQEIMTMVRRGIEVFASAVANQSSQATASQFAVESLQLGLQAAEKLAVQYAYESVRRLTDQNISMSKLFGCRFQPASLTDEVAKQVAANCNAATIQFNWGELETNSGDFNWSKLDKQMQWCRKHKLRVLGGPILDLSRSVPDWIFVWGSEFEQIRAAVRDYVTAVVKRYGSEVQVWNAAGGLLQQGQLRLRQEERLRLAMDCIETIRQLDPRTPAIISFGQLWADSHPLSDRHPVTQFHLADSLVRANAGMAGIGLELQWGYWPGGTMCRDLLELSHHLDRWAVLGSPLIINVSAPHGANDDTMAQCPLTPQPLLPDNEFDVNRIRDLILVLMSKPSIQGIFWSEVSNAVEHDYLGAGFLDSKSVRTVALEIWQEFYDKYQRN